MEQFLQLPIRRRGKFMKDDFFKDFQGDFDLAIQNVMDKHTGRSLLADQFSLYRKMRENTPDTTGPAASVSETTDSTVIVLDMSDFVKGSISVRTRRNYVVVEADYEEKKFKREFRLSLNTNFDGLKTAMSNEGILTITAPKKGTTQADAAKPSEPCVKLNLGDTDDIDKELLTEEIKDASKINVKEEEEPPLSPSIKDRVLSISKKGNFFQDEYFENVWTDFEKAMDEMVQKEEKKRLEDRDERIRRKKDLASKLKSDMLLDAEMKQKEFFERARKRESFPDLRVPQYSRLNSYQNLRSWAPESETQACTITKDANGYKIIMDVKNYGNGDGDVSVKASEGYLTVVGKKGPLTFKKEFTISGLTKPEQVNASVSEDGILTITAAV